MTGPEFTSDSKMLYSLFVQFLGTTGYGSNLVIKYKNSQNGYKLNIDLRNHYHNDAYMGNMASAANQTLTKLVYKGERKFFNIETYYSRMTRAFNDLQNSGATYALNENQKISKFEIGLKEPNAIKYHIESKIEWDSMPNPKTFDDFYNLFSKRMSQYMTMTSSMTPQDDQRSRVAQVQTQRGHPDGNQFNNRSRGQGRGGRFRGRGRGGRGGRGRGRHSRGYNPYSLSRGGYDSFIPEARSYPPEEWNRLSDDQQNSVIKAKVDSGWLNGYTPPEGFVLDQTGRATPSTSMVAAVQSVIGQISQSQTDTECRMIPNIPSPPALPPRFPSVIQTPNATAPSQAVMAFGYTGQRRNGDTSSISSIGTLRIIVNRRPLQEAYDRNGNPL